MTYSELCKKSEELLEYADLCDDELGEFCKAITNPCVNSDVASDDFIEALGKEVLFQLDHFKSKSKIVTRSRVFSREVKILEWNEK